MLSKNLKSIAGVADERTLPKFAARSFRATFRANGNGEAVVLFDDTFNNYFRPGTAASAERLLAAAGCAVELPGKHVCCGRPYYDFGMLESARETLERTMRVLEPQLERGLPVVVLEPGCLSVFRDELHELFPRDSRAKRLGAAVTSLGELLLKKDWRGAVNEKVLLHGHCHQKALWGTVADAQLLERAGCEVLAPDTGCCGMAGSFGYRKEFYETSQRIAQLALLPALDAAPQATVLASGFSCREQIESLGRRPTLHLAELLARALPA